MAKITDAEFELPAGYVTKNLMRGLQVTTCEQVLELAKKGESIWIPLWGKTTPAAFLANWQVCRLVDFLTQYDLFTVIKSKT